jgi:D-amino-acid dehydrogenase
LTETTTIDVAIVGAGIIGLASAFKLTEAGRNVVLLDRKGMAEETSRGNAGAFAFSDVIPLATSGVLGKLPKWLSDPLGPLTIRPEYLPQITPWLMRFWRAGWPDRVAAGIRAQSEMMRVARREAESLIASAGLQGMIHSDGILELYETEGEMARTAKDDAAKAAEGIEFRHVRGAELAELQPGLSPKIVCGTFIPKWQTVSDPYDYALAIGKAATDRGAKFRKAEVTQLRPQDDGVIIELSDGSAIRAKHVVVAGGAWSKRLTQPLGDDIPLETERGYNTTLPGYSFDLKRQLFFGGHGFVVTPLQSGIRIGVPWSWVALACRPISNAPTRCSPRPHASCRASRRPVASSGWAFVRRCPTACRRSVFRAARATSSMPSVTAISG